jgi:hypothetical protein
VGLVVATHLFCEASPLSPRKKVPAHARFHGRREYSLIVVVDAKTNGWCTEQLTAKILVLQVPIH